LTLQIKPDAIVFCDASVLYQAQIRDLLLELCVHHDLFKLRWSKQIQDEWINKLSERNPKARTSLEKTRKRMENAVPECLVSNYGAIEDNLQLHDMNDRHVLAAAIHSGSEFLLTENLRDFPESILSIHHITAISVDELFSAIGEQYQDLLLGALKTIINRLKNPPITLKDWCLRMEKIGFPKSSKIILDTFTPHMMLL
jgi:predicted nucleic acid-binding protein